MYFGNILGKIVDIKFNKDSKIITSKEHCRDKWVSTYFTSNGSIFSSNIPYYKDMEAVTGVWRNNCEGYVFLDSDNDVLIKYNILSGLTFFDKPVRSYWDYRVMRKIYEDGTIEEGIHEVYYKDNKPHTCTVAPVAPLAVDGEDLADILDKYTKAIEKPTLIYKDI